MLASIIRPVSAWVQKTAKVLAAKYPNIFSGLVSKIIDALLLETPESATAIVRGNKKADWVTETINSPTGNLSIALLDDPQVHDLTREKGFSNEWLQHLERVLALPGDLRRHALVICAHSLSWFFFVDPMWTQVNLLSVLSSNNRQDKEALWAGFLWNGNAHGHELFAILKPHMLRMAKTKNLEHRGHTGTMTGLLLSAWALTDDNTGERRVTNEELHDILLNSNDNVRSCALWLAESWARKEKEKWLPLLLDLLRNVWPRQIVARSETVSAKLCDIAFSNEEYFPKLAVVILPLLTKIDRDHIMLPNLLRSQDNIVDRHPRETLDLLYAVLPDNATTWPYGVDATIARIGEADGTLSKDEKLIELKRKWDAR